MTLKLYNKKRDITKTSEPKGKATKYDGHRFVVQEHHATNLHFDFRLEMSGAMKSWAVPKGPSMNPSGKHLAVMVEDHPIGYYTYEGEIPVGQYGAGEVRRWDSVTYTAIGDQPIETQLKAGKLTFILKGKKLKGEFHMVEMKGRGKNNWLLFRHEDKYADPEWQMKTILHYGSRKESPTLNAKKDVDKNVLEKLVKQTAKKKTLKKKTLKSKTK